MKRNLGYLGAFLLILLMVASVGFWEHHKKEEKEAPPTMPPHVHFALTQMIIAAELNIPDIYRFNSTATGSYRAPDGTPVICLKARGKASYIASDNNTYGVFVLSSLRHNTAALWIVKINVGNTVEKELPIEQLPEPLRTYAEKLDSGQWNCNGNYGHRTLP